MNKNGFIATSLLYSFFLLFCALILVFIGNMAQKSLLLNKEIDQINEDLHSIKYLKDAKIGSYFRLNVCVSSSYFNQADTLDYIIFDNGTTNENNMASLISKNYSFKLNSGASMSPEQEVQMKMMRNISLVMIGTTSLSVSAAISLYWIVNSTCTIIQNLYVKKETKNA